MFPNPIVKALDVLKDGAARLLVGGKMFPRGAFSFQGSEEPFYRRIIPTIAFATHADLDAVIFEEALIRFARVLTSAVRVM